MSFLNDMFGGGDEDAYRDYEDELNRLASQYDPYVQSGIGNLHGFDAANQGMLGDPTGEINKLADQFHTSAYQRKQLGDVSNLMNANAANTGMLGSQSANLNLGSQLSNMQNRFMQNYIDQGMNQYNQALRNKYMLAQLGLGALGSRSGLSQEGALGGVEADQSRTNALNNMLGDVGGFLGGFL